MRPPRPHERVDNERAARALAELVRGTLSRAEFELELRLLQGERFRELGLDGGDEREERDREW